MEETKTSGLDEDEEYKLDISNPIILNIGGIKYSTSMDTLLRYSDSYFCKMFSGKFCTKPNKDGEYFIDRDGSIFSHILNFLRSGHLIVDINDDILVQKLVLEAHYYQIDALINIVCPKIDSVILSRDDCNFYDTLESWISFELLRETNSNNNNNKCVSFPKLRFDLLYRASKHGFSSSAFHRHCDHKKNTLCIIRANDTIFGGYTSIPWESCNDGRAVDQININTKSQKSFTFFLQCNSDIWKEKYKLNKCEKWDYCGSNKISYLQNPCYSVYHHKSFGPVFGYRPCFEYNGDLCAHIVIGNNCNNQLNSRIDSFVGEHLSVRKHMTDSFFVYDYEVFQIKQI